ncbi:MAG TPA: dienelactone hydrolase family protein [Gemmatimonadaceae bacterium]|nr:dienelactone hydrolase family protein [Gemmatimonadaceae bacterium]
MGDMVTFKANGRTADGYLARPASGRGPGVVVIQEWWGLVGHITDVADRFANEGFFALAPDLYHGEKTKSPDAAGKMMMALNIAEAGKDLRGAADYLIGIDGVEPKKVASIGFCMGGQLSLYAACEFPERIGACVDFYGVHPAVKPDVSRLSGPVLAHFATRDTSTPPDAANGLVEQIRSAGKRIDAYFYEADHAFFNDQRPQVYNEQAATLAWTRTIDFLRKALV